ncbi:hypothetical protein M407DRAFT_218308 [Tulasnella calospora MUT 4182]|uniref:NAD(P)-binding protein n=1 Tax=Tulasnella calospora MUT 4182 TaxID=1051891 RepID=A0A0C3LJ01_9AGAM|nr:hypothetical protein M407DRAFT_218308 [Tulasnella calospora MUT 4182]
MASFLSETFPPKSKFDPERDIPDLAGKVVIVTGGNTGIGKHTIQALLSKNAKVYMAARSKEKAEDAIAELKGLTGKDAVFLQLDLANLDSITKAANEFMSKEPALHLLFNNGGVMIPPLDQLTSDGYDLQFGTNVLGHAHFTLCLLPALLAGAKSSSDGKARVVNTASNGATFINKIDFDALRDGPKRQKMGKLNLYYQSKLGNVVFSNELAKRYASQGIISHSLNPGSVKSDLSRHTPSLLLGLVSWMQHPVEFGALTQLWVGTSPEMIDTNGGYFIPWARVGNMPTGALNSEVGLKLWDWIEEQRKGHF